MNDEQFYALFAVDPADLVAAGLAPALPSALDPHPADVIAAGLALALPPIAGGSILDDFFDWVGDRFGELGDLGSAIGEAFGNLWDTIWGKLGGALRFVWKWVDDAFDWVGSSLNSMLNQIWDWLFAAGSGVRDFLWNRVGDVKGWVDGSARWVKDRVDESARWVRDRVDESARWVRDRAWDAARWVRDRAWDAARWVRDRAWDAARWVGDTVATNAGWVRDRVGEFSEWIVGSVNTIVNSARNVITDWFDFLWEEGIQPIMGAAESIGEALSRLLETIGDKIRDALDWVVNNAFGGLVDIVNRKLAIPGKLIRGHYTNLFDLMDDITDPAPAIIAGLAGPIILALVIALLVSAVMALLMQPLTEPHVQDMRATIGAQLLGRADLSEARWRDLDVDVDGQLARYGFDAQNIRAIAELDKRIPGSGDLVRFAVREAFDRAKAEALGFVTPMPGEFAAAMKQQGFTQEWAERYWWAHWDLPSVTQGFEMFHRLRDEFTEADLKGLLTAQDVPEKWQERFIKTAYQPLTRVDIRRMFVMGLLDKGQVKERYLDRGFSPADADLMTEFTIRWAAPDEDGELKEMRDLAQTTIRQGYRRHVIDRELALDYLVEAGYTEDVADYFLTIDDVALGIRPDLDADIDVRNLSAAVILRSYRDGIWDNTRAQTELEALGYLPGSAELLISLEDVARESSLTALRTSVIKEKYSANDIDRAQAAGELDAIGLGPERRDLLLERWDLDKAQKPKRLSIGQLRTAFRLGQLTDVDLLERISALGYADADAQLLVDGIDEEPTARERRLSVSQLQRMFRDGVITDVELLQGFIALDYSQADAEKLVNITDPDPGRLERRLSVTQLRQLFQAGLLTEADLRDRLLALGYSDTDADMLIELATVEPAPVVRRVSVSQLQRFFQQGVITDIQMLQGFIALDYSPADAQNLVDITDPDPGRLERRLSVGQLTKSFQAALLTAVQLLDEFLALGYSQRDAEFLVVLAQK